MRANHSLHEVDRCRRVSELIRRELSTLLAREVDDQRVRMVSITAVRISKDLKQADVYVSNYDSTDATSTEKSSATAPVTPAEIEKTLNHASKYLRYLLGRNVNLRSTPALRFHYDNSIRHGVEMTTRIDALNQKHGER